MIYLYSKIVILSTNKKILFKELTHFNHLNIECILAFFDYVLVESLLALGSIDGTDLLSVNTARTCSVTGLD